MCVVTKRTNPKSGKGKTLPQIVSLLTLRSSESEGASNGRDGVETAPRTADAGSKAAAVPAGAMHGTRSGVGVGGSPLELPLPAVVSTSTLSLAAAAATAACTTSSTTGSRSTSAETTDQQQPILLPAPRTLITPPQLQQLQPINQSSSSSSSPKLAIPTPAYAVSACSSHRHSRRHELQHVDHSYHEHMNDRPTTTSTKHVTRGGVVHPFPVKLHHLLDAISIDGKDDVISWMPHGRCFMVHKPKEFVTSVMPEYFKQSKFASFQRQLNL